VSHELREQPLFAIACHLDDQLIPDGTDITWDNQGGNIVPVGATGFLLQPGTYILETQLNAISSPGATIAWVDAANAPVGAMVTPDVFVHDNFRHQLLIQQLFAPLVATTVKLRVITADVAAHVLPADTWLYIRSLNQ
jgi:hypothetical protein